jgi:Ca2+-binding RTX toxin-like protein
VNRIIQEEEDVAYNLANYNVITGTNNRDYIGRDKELPKNDYIKAGDGADHVYAGNDYLWGNDGADTFHFTVDNGNDYLYGFDPSEGDRFLLYGIDPAAVSLESTIFGTELHLDGDKDTVLFVGVGANAVVQGFAGFQPLAAYDWMGA